MEELAATFVAAVAIGVAILLADLMGFLFGLGWGHYSKKLKLNRQKKSEVDIK